MWFIPKARSLNPGPITAKRASYRLCFSASRRSIEHGRFRRRGNVCRCICVEHSNVVGNICRRGEEFRPIGWSALEIVWLMKDCHSASAKRNLCKGVFDSVVPSGIAIYVTADQGVVSRAGTNTIATDCTSQCNTQYNHFSYLVYNLDWNIDGACKTTAIQDFINRTINRF